MLHRNPFRGNVLALAVLILVALPSVALAASLGAAEIRVLGFQVHADTRPDVAGLQNTMTAVKDVPSAVGTFVGLPGQDALPTLPSGWLVRAEITGPGLVSAVPLTALPNQPFELPALRVAGEYNVTNVRLTDETGAIVLSRDAALPPVAITVIDELLVTQVTSRPLSAQEIKDLGIVIDEDNFTAMNFTVGLTLGSTPVTIQMPVFVPATYGAMVQTPNPITIPSLQEQFDGIEIPNFSLVGFRMQVPDDPELSGIELPAVNGVIVIPGNVAFLNQFFSVFLQATNVAPAGSGLVLQAARAAISLPKGGDNIPDTGDDPLRLAEVAGQGTSPDLPLLDNAGADAIEPQGTNQAEFLVEGLREGTHAVTFDVAGDLYVPALSRTVPLSGKAAGVVCVKNPTFSLVLAHPSVVRAGEEYEMVATVTNTSQSPANLFSLRLATRSLSGCRMADGETELRTLESLAPGQAESFTFRLVARTTGEVRGTVALADQGVNGSFLLTAGVGDSGIPLSPDTLVLPRWVDFLPDQPADVTFEALRLLGQAYSVAVAPEGSLPEGVARIAKSFVYDRGVALGRAGLHVRFGEAPADAVADLFLDFAGADFPRVDEVSENPEAATANLAAFDALRRTTDAGRDFGDAVAAVLGENVEAVGLAAFQQSLAERYASRPGHLSAALSSSVPGALLWMEDGNGNTAGPPPEGGLPLREVPFAQRLVLTALDQMILDVAPYSEKAPYTVEFSLAVASTAGLSLVVPSGAGMVRVAYPALALPAGARGRVVVNLTQGEGFALLLDTDNDGTADQTVAPASVTPVTDPPPAVLGAHQWGKGTVPVSGSLENGDALGCLAGVLFSEEVDKAAAGDVARYSLPGIGLDALSVKADRRLVFLDLKKPVGPFVSRTLTVKNMPDLAGHILVQQDTAVAPDPELGPGGAWEGQVVTADGTPVSFAPVQYIQAVEIRDGLTGMAEPRDVVVSSLTADGLGRVSLDFVLRNTIHDENGQPLTTFRLEAQDPETGRSGKVISRVAVNGQRMGFNVVIRGYGGVAGRVYEPDGSVAAGGDPGTPGSMVVYAQNLSTGETALSWVDADGFYSFPRTSADGATRAPSLSAGNVMLRVVRTSDLSAAVATVSVTAGDTPVTRDLVLVSGTGTVSGRVLEQDGVTGASGVRVQVSAPLVSPGSLEQGEVETGVVAVGDTDAGGWFSFTAVPAGDISVMAFRSATLETARAFSSLAAGGERTLTLLLPGSGGVVRGLVRDALGAPVGNARVTSGYSMVNAGNDGRFEMPGMPVGSFCLVAQGPGSLALGRATGAILSSDDVQEVLITLEAVGTIAGTVLAADEETPVPYQKVQLWYKNQYVMKTTVTDAGGNYRFTGFPTGDYSVRAVAADYGDGGMAFTTIRTAGDVRDANIVFRGLGEIKGRVVQGDVARTPVLTDVVITRPVWRIVPGGNRQNNYYLDFVEEAAENEDLAEAVDTALASEDFDLATPVFFVLVNEPVLIQSDILENGAVTGRFDFTGPAAAGAFTVEAYGSFLTPASKSGVIPRTTIPAERIVDVEDIVLTPATGSVTGTVFMPDGVTPVGAGVQVTIRSLDGSGSLATGGASQTVDPDPVFTDANGRYDFPLVLRGRCQLTADTGEPYTPAQGPEDMQTEIFAGLNVRLQGEASGVVPSGTVLVADIRLKDAAAVRVRVLTAGGSEAQASVRLSNGDPANTDLNGEVVFFPVPEGSFSAFATGLSGAVGGTLGEIPRNPANGFVKDAVITLGTVVTGDGTTVTPSFFGTVTGRVYKADGSGVTNPVQVTVTSSGAGILCTSDGEGAYTATNVPGGFFSVTAFEPLTARTGRATGSLTQADQVVDVPVTLEGLGTVNGTIRSAAGDGIIAGARVVLTPDGGQELVTLSDGQGGFSFPGVPLGTYEIRVQDSGSGLAGSASGELLADGDVNTTDVFLEASGNIRGVVYEAGVYLDGQGLSVDENGDPLASPEVVAYVTVELSGGGGTNQVQTDANGEFAFAGNLPLGDYVITVRIGTDGARTQVSLAFGGQEAFVPLALAGAGTVTGKVLGSDCETAVANAPVELSSNSPFSSGVHTAVTQADGSYTLTGVPVGAFSVSVTSDNLAGGATGTLARHGEALALTDTCLSHSGTIQGSVLLPGGALAQDTVADLSGGDVRRVRTADAGGLFSFGGVPLGTYFLSLLHPATGAVTGLRVTLSENGQVLDLGGVVLDNESPRVVFAQPASGATGVSPSTSILVRFSEAVDPSTLSASTFQVLVAGQAKAGQIFVTGDQAEFVPDAPLPDMKLVQVTVKADTLDWDGRIVAPGVRDLAGRGLAADHRFYFTTADVTPPSVVSLSPAQGAVNVNESSVVRMEFSETVDRASIQSFTLLSDSGSVAGSMNASPIANDRVFVFTPQTALAANATYTAVMTGPVADLSGNAMAEAEVISVFSTTDTVLPELHPLACDLGTALVAGQVAHVTATPVAAPDVKSVEFFVNGALASVDGQAPYGLTLTAPSGQGNTLVVEAVAVDPAGNRSVARRLDLSVAANRPPVLVMTPPAAEVGQNQTVVIEVDATDDVGLYQVSFTADNGAVASGLAHANGAASYHYVFSFAVPAGVAPGTVLEIQAAATDVLGAVSVSPVATLVVTDGLPPAITIGSPAANTAFDPGGTVEVFVRADDAGGVDRLAIQVSGSFAYQYEYVLGEPANPASHVFSFDVPDNATSVNPMYVRITARDASGNESVLDRTLRVNDRLLPWLEVAPVNGSQSVEPGTPFTARVTARDERGVVRVDASAGDFFNESRTITESLATIQDFTFTVPEATALGQQISFTARAWDAAGNLGESAPLVLTTADLTAPVAEILAPEAGATIQPGDMLDVTARATDRYGVFMMEFQESSGSSSWHYPPLGTTEAQHTFHVQVPAQTQSSGGGTILLRIKAEDEAHNSSWAQDVTVNVADIIGPEVSSIQPADGAVAVPMESAVRVTFNEPVDQATVNDTTLTLEGSAGAVPGVFSFESNAVAVFTPTASLSPGAAYTVTVTTGITDPSGNALENQAVSRFTTFNPDTVPPVLESVLPENGAVVHSLATQVVLQFNEAIDQSTAGTGISLTGPSGQVAGEFILSDGDKQVTFSPSGGLPAWAAYTIGISAEVTETNGNALAGAPFTFHFTATPPDTTPPTVVSVEPINGATGVGLAPMIRVTFSEPIDPAGFTQASFQVSAGGVPVAGTRTLTVDNTLATFTAQANLAYSTEYAITLTSDIRDLAGNALAPAPFESRFTTRLDTDPPYVVSITPANNATGVSVYTTVEVLFNEPVATALVNEETFTVTANGQPVAGSYTFTENNARAIFTPDMALRTATVHTVQLGNGILDLAGNALTPFTSTFLTRPDTEPPFVAEITPEHNATDISVHSTVEVLFSEPVALVNSETFRVLANGQAVAGSYSVTEGGARAIFTPNAVLPLATSCMVELENGILDLAGNSLIPYSSAFTTSDFALIQPKAGQTVVGGSHVIFEAAATGSLSVARVAFSVNGVDVGSMTDAPYMFNWTVPDTFDSVPVPYTVCVRGELYGGGIVAAPSVVIHALPGVGGKNLWGQNTMVRIVASDPSSWPDHFGCSVAVSDQLAIVGAKDYANFGSAYAFIPHGSGTWLQQAELILPPEQRPYVGGWGNAVDVGGNTALIGVPYQGINNVGNAGTVRIWGYITTTNSWIQSHYCPVKELKKRGSEPACCGIVSLA